MTTAFLKGPDAKSTYRTKLVVEIDLEKIEDEKIREMIMALQMARNHIDNTYWLERILDFMQYKE